MDQSHLVSLLEQITGDLRTSNPKELKALQSAQQKIAHSLLQSDDTGSERLFVSPDFYARGKVDERVLSGIPDIAKKILASPSDENIRAFVRTVPLASEQIAASVPDWAVGAKAAETIGPFINAEGRNVWIDIYKTVKLTTLYLGTQPILLFNHQSVRVIRGRVTNQYKIAAGTVWIKANLLSPSAPSNRFVGLKVSSGILKLSATPTVQGDKFILSPASILDLSLNMVQDTDEGASSGSKYGKDARDSTYKLPETLQFTWNASTKKLTAITFGNGSCEIYGQKYNFSARANALSGITFQSELNILCFPWKADKTEFTILKNSSPFLTMSEKAPVIKSSWALGTAVLNIQQPLQVEGNGGILFECGKGLRASWQGLENEDARLTKPFIFCNPGNIGIIEFAGDISAASQRFNLWKDKKDLYSSSVDLTFYKKSSLVISISSEKSTELMMAQCNGVFHLDRPVKADGEPFGLRTEASVLMLSTSDTAKNIYVIDDSILTDHTTKENFEEKHKPVAIALENALFTVSPVSACLLFGECSDDWTKIIRANLFLIYGLYRYLPTLPDPYVGKLSHWEKLFGANDSSLRNQKVSNQLLICAVRYSGVNNEEDRITTEFYFGTLPPDFTKLPEEEQEPARQEEIPKKRGTNAADSRKIYERVKTIRGEKKVLGRGTVLSERMQEVPLKSIRSFGKYAPALKINTANIEKGIFEKRPLRGKFHLPKEAPQGIKPTPEIITAPGGKDISILQDPYKNDYEDVWDNTILGGGLNAEHFALLDISSNANQMGVSIGNNMIIVETAKVVRGEENQASVENNRWPFFVEGMQVKAKGDMVRAFTLPQISWEPMINLTEPDRTTPSSPKLAMDPEAGYLFYENDGGPTRIWNNNQQLVALAPIPVVDSIIEDFKSNPNNYTISAFTLPFGLKAINYVSKHFVENKKPEITNLRPKFRKDKDDNALLEGGIQLSFQAGDYGKAAPAGEKDSPMFPGYIIQQNNLLNDIGVKSGASNLGHRATEIFNNEFLFGPLYQSKELGKSRGVPLSRMDITGYGANIFSNWLSPTAAMAQTSQAKFDVLFGRTAHEVIQVKSILYPWGIRVVRTITVFRSATGYIYRTDSGWKAESDGKFDFSYRYLKRDEDPGDLDLTPDDFQTIPDQDNPPPYEFHPGIISGLFNVRNIKDAPEVIEFTSVNTIIKGNYYVNGLQGQEIKAAKTFTEEVKCGGVYFDADVEIENVVQGHTNKRVVSKKILGYVQVAPAGKPLTADQLKDLLEIQKGSIGGDIDCVIDINNSNQQMRLNRFDVNNSQDGGTKPVFVVAARGAVVLPKAGSWSVVQHKAGTGTVTPLPSGTSVPLIRTGKWIKDKVVDPLVTKKELLRIAHPLEILRAASDETINFGFLQTTATQKALFLTPAYGKGITKLLSKTPPVFADAYRLMEGNSIFPNIGNAIDSFGKAMPMLNGIDKTGKKVQAFVNNALKDGGTKVFELMEVEVKKAGEAVIDQGMSLLQKGLDGAVDKALKFDIPPFEVDLVKTKPLRIYVEYITQKKPDKPNKPFTEVVPGKLNFDIDSFSEELGDKWKSRLNNLAMVVDLGDMKRLMTIKGNFDASKTKETGFGGDDSNGNGFPVPEIEFSDALQPVIDILEVLSELSSGDYGAVMKKGLKIAMSNSGEIWEYKFEANKEIPVVRFPPSDELYNSAQTPLKLEASLSLGVYFNAALKVTTDPKDLLPTAGAFLKFHGGLQVMCFSVGAGSIFAVGNVDVKIACDTKVGPSLALDFAFGVQIVVSLPVVGNASVSYLMGINMYADKDKVVIAALMLFKGHAELVGGLVCVTIMIEAKGIIERSGGETQASAQVTFALDISVAFIIDISFSKTWGEDRQIA